MSGCSDCWTGDPMGLKYNDDGSEASKAGEETGEASNPGVVCCESNMGCGGNGPAPVAMAGGDPRFSMAVRLCCPCSVILQLVMSAKPTLNSRSLRLERYLVTRSRA